MRLSEFIRHSTDVIVAHSVEFAQSLKPLSHASIDIAVLRDHLPLVLQAIALDLEQPQTRAESISKSKGNAPALVGETAAQTHGRLRAQVGLSVSQAIAEYRVLRAVITRLWSDAEKGLPYDAIPDLVRFNEAIDQAIAESVAFHSAESERWRDMLIAVIGHDLRGPLQTLAISSDALARGGVTGSLPTSIVDVIRRAVQRLSVLLDSLLDYSRTKLGSGMTIKREPDDLAAICRAELELLKTSLPDVTMDFTSTGDCTGSFDVSRVREALSNLVSNAAQYKHADTPIRIFVDGAETDVTVSVMNAGDPIPHEVLQTFFEPLRRRDTPSGASPRRNLGIGLFVVREIAKAHGGSVSAEASDGHVCFAMRLPKATPAE